MLVFAHSGYFHDLLDSFALGVVILNARGRVYAANTAAAALLGHSREELISDPAVAADVFRRTDDPKALRRYLREALRREHPGEARRLRYRTVDGKSLHLSLTISHLVENEKIFGVMLQITDVTEIIALHERERHIMDEKYRVERERVESLRALSSAVAHQLRNPAMSIGGLSGLLLKKCPPDDPARPFLQAILEESKRLETIVAAVGEATLPLSPRTSCFSLWNLAASRLAHVRALAAERGLSAVWNLAGQDGRLCLDGTLLGQALDEVLLNAAEASLDEGRVDVLLAPQPGAGGHAGSATITVRDRGPGIAADIAPYLFDPFFTTKSVGVGMGLCRAKRVMAALDGEIRVENHPEGGVVAILSVPGGPPSGEPPDLEHSRDTGS
ncbi:sensor histidine kinase [hydrocarbon metagenome]|uniref:Sensor histidine kinase n=1 Tax=hydrocarbon metagenome TaxID=938273 RepID=A0A0W8G603_9ZZZZ